ncbi:polymorphic toxin-type HINT domain-containing protein, partial [Streptomyces sp. NPDC048643]|uniref:polymorphic toxin-type HINT domain-containing protein n=1 Tax=Streptomyces sp. NPDC048643 TaxID=3155637 RepID=UPI003422ACD3
KESAAADRAASRRARTDQRRTVTWPGAGSATLKLTKTATAKAEPGSLPLTLTAPQASEATRTPPVAKAVSVKVLDQAAAKRLGVKGVVLAVTGPTTGGKARLGIGYKAFATAYGGDWAGRLQIRSLPACALMAPDKQKCRTSDLLTSDNDRGHENLSSTLAFTPSKSPQTMVLAVAAGTQSGGGDYKATPLAASSTWSAGGSSGTFTWSYPLRTPPAAAGPSPQLDISYDSGAVDGRTASTNNQGSQIGEGFDLTSSYIERKYGSCDDDGQSDKYDQCWKYENASLVLDGKATELVKDDTTGTWRLKDDDASTVTHSTGADNGDDGDDISAGKGDGKGEFWTVITGDGTKYVFGQNKLAGAAASDRTNSVWTVPVFGDDDGEPGYSSGTSFSGRAKNQAWRWNLDYVEDTHANAMTYWYTDEHNNYDKLGDDTTGSDYTRGGYLKEIRYGQRASTLFSGSPAASDKVVFSYDERCDPSISTCDSLTEDNRDSWPDVPFDAICKDGDKCTGNVAPTFFTRKRLTSITTYAWNAAATTPGFEGVDTWTLKQQYLDPGDTGDSTDQSLWLDEIKHTGKHGTEVSLDPVKFTHTFLPNRVDGASDNILSLDKPRLYTVTSEAGAQTTVTYAEADCVAGQTMPKVDENTKRCYPVYWSPNGGKTPILDWFQKYPVTAVSTNDPFGGSQSVQNSYQYSGGGAWHYNDDPMTPAKERTWSIWRGFSKVTHLTGNSANDQLKTVTVYMRGMNGDRVLGSDGKTPDADARKSADVTGIKAAKITDSEQFAGFSREAVTYNGSDEISGTINDPWSQKTATQHKSYADTEAYYVRTAASHARTNVTGGITPHDRVRTTLNTYDEYGMTSRVEDRGDDDVSGDETCTRNTYARNDTLGINTLISRVRVVAKPCATLNADLDLPTDATRPGDVISDTATVFDSKTYTTTQTPTKGEVQWTGRAKSYAADGTPSWQKIGTVDYDSLGRPTIVKDANDLPVSSTLYTPVATGPLTASEVTDAGKFKATSSFDFATGSVLKFTDPNDKITENQYDGLGRVTKTWLPNRPTVLNKTPNYVYDYHVTNSAMSWVSTGTLNGDATAYNTTYEFFDSLLRSRQVQTPSPSGGRLVSLTLYDNRGLAISAQGDIWDDTSVPSSQPVQTAGGAAPAQTDTTYDGAGRAVQTVTKNYNVPRWTIDTTYTGDTVSVSAPDGGHATGVTTNALGQTTERREYAGPKPTGTDYTTTGYTYTHAGQQETITGPDKTTWSYTYDLSGRQATSTDPDKGYNATEYNNLDQVISTTPNRDASKKLLYAYDDLGRKTGMWQVDKTDANKLAAWGFDAVAKGQPDTATRYEGGAGTAGKAYTQKVTAYDPLYRATTSQLILPSTDPLVSAGVPATLNFSTSYKIDGTVSQYAQPAAGGLPSETVSYKYNATGQQTSSLGVTGLLQGAQFTPEGDLTQLNLGMSPGDTAKKVYLHWAYENGTRRLKRSFVTDDVHSYMPQDATYTQDDAGNVTSIFDASTQGGTAKTDNQCFTYDGNSRIAEAWTPKTADCAVTGRTKTNIDGAAPYWTSYTYTAAGQRKTETKHTTSGDSTTTYQYDATTDIKPHTLDNTTGATTGTYTYDASGNTTTRPGPTAQQTLVWNTEGRLAKTTENTKESSYLYDAGGALLIRRAKGDGDTVLYLGGQEIRLTVQGSTKSVTGTRYYTANGQTIAVRTAKAGTSGTKLSFLASDPHGTASLAFDGTTYAITKRYSTPFGASRGTKPTTWPDDKAFLGKPADETTSLTHIGAREYDPAIGQFISVDPILSPDQHQSLNGYSYANNSPISNSDPTGTKNERDGGGGFGGVPNKGCPPFCSPDGQPHGPSTGNGGSNRNGDGTPGGGIVWPCQSCSGTAHASSSGKKSNVKQGPDDPDSDQVGVDSMGTPCYSGSFNPGCTPGQDDQDYSHGSWWDVLDLLVGVAFASVPEKAQTVPDAPAGKAAKVGEEVVSHCKCFLAGTKVLMADGTTKSIEKIKVGDRVQAADPRSGEKGPRKVERLIVTEDDKKFSELSIETSDGIERLTATYEHPFWSPSERAWIEASSLAPGMTLLSDDGRTVSVRANRIYIGHARTYNLTVGDLHTYYVLAGQTPVLVHNAGGPGFDLDRYDRPGYSNYVLVDRNNVPYYSGMFGPNQTPATVQARHGKNNNRYNIANGDRIDVFPGTRTYGQSRLLEQRMTDELGTYIGEDGNNYRGNRQNPMKAEKVPGYLAYESFKNGGCP